MDKFQPRIQAIPTRGLSAGGAASVIAMSTYGRSSDSLHLQVHGSDETHHTLLANFLMVDGYLGPALRDYYGKTSEWRALSEKLYVKEHSSPTPLTRPQCLAIANEVIRKGELGICPQIESELVPSWRRALSSAPQVLRPPVQLPAHPLLQARPRQGSPRSPGRTRMPASSS